MNYKIRYSIFLLFMLGCGLSFEATYQKQMKESFIHEFKLTYFQKLFYEGFNRPKEIKQLFMKDGSGFSEPLLSKEDLTLIDSFVNLDNQLMYKDSIDRIGRVSEGAQGKHVLDFALSKYESRWLDSLARIRYKVYARRENEIRN